MRYKKILVTGGAGFIGSAFIRFGLTHFPELERIVNLDLLTYAANLNSLTSIDQDPRYVFIHGDICDEALVYSLCQEYQIDALIHFAAESHVDRSLTDPKSFIDTNIYGTFSLLEVVRKLPHIHFHHVSTDEVYGSLETGRFSESSHYRPNSPYSASKAASDHLVRAWGKSFNLSTTLSHSSNNYGPFQASEKFIPCMILNCLNQQPLPIYGDGSNIRDWLYVDDHASALWTILEKGLKGEVYDIGGGEERPNLHLAHDIIKKVADLTTLSLPSLHSLLFFAPDRKGHDFRYAIDSTKIKTALHWHPKCSFEEGLQKTVAWYVENHRK